MSLTFIDLFAGIGGIRLAFTEAGFNPVFSSEWNPHSRKTYYANFQDIPFGDIGDLKAEMLPRFDLLAAGFPCQPFSSIGKREGLEHASQGTMFHEILRVLAKKKPRAIFLENVVGILTIDGGQTWLDIQSALRELGYHLETRILDSSDFGIPQKRKRVFIVGFRNKRRLSSFAWPEPTLESADFAPHIEWGARGFEISKHLQQHYIYKDGEKLPQILNQDWHGPIKTLVASYHKIQRLTGTFVNDGETGLRLLSEMECKRAMGFPDDFIFPVSRTQMYRQLGNSVAVPLVERIAREMRRLLD